MSTKEKLKREIDTLPDKLLEQVYEYLNSLRTPKNSTGKILSEKELLQYENCITLSEEPMKYQKRMRDEWK